MAVSIPLRYDDVFWQASFHRALFLRLITDRPQSTVARTKRWRVDWRRQNSSTFQAQMKNMGAEHRAFQPNIFVLAPWKNFVSSLTYQTYMIPGRIIEYYITSGARQLLTENSQLIHVVDFHCCCSSPCLIQEENEWTCTAVDLITCWTLFA